jgi:hypothetical protein
MAEFVRAKKNSVRRQKTEQRDIEALISVGAPSPYSIFLPRTLCLVNNDRTCSCLMHLLWVQFFIGLSRRNISSSSMPSGCERKHPVLWTETIFHSPYRFRYKLASKDIRIRIS